MKKQKNNYFCFDYVYDDVNAYPSWVTFFTGNKVVTLVMSNPKDFDWQGDILEERHYKALIHWVKQMWPYNENFC